MKEGMKTSGAALVIVLAFLVMTVSLVVAFTTMVMLERVSASATVVSSDTLLLSETTLALVQNQIRAATAQEPTRTWASQPGMIRTFRQDGSLHRAYKLYSASSLVAGDIAAALAQDVPPNDWAARQATWADLNAPVVSVTDGGDRVFPIAHPDAISKVEGFSVAAGTPGATSAQPLPMPVRWLYVLRNGDLVPPEDRDEPDQVRVPGATDDNPIIGRIAFWTDDESCKLNINTAAGGHPWVTPITGASGGVGSWPDREMALRQPVQREYQRYPGHPATTSLAPVLASYFGLSGNDLHEAILGFSPRYQPGGSQGGSVYAHTPLSKGSGSLFASVDEMVFNPVDTGASRSLYNTARIDKETVNETRFFLTASSNAPEVNLFSLPRVSIWPVSSDPSSTRRTPYDQLNLHCSTIGTGGTEQLFAFTRTSPDSVQADFSGRNRQLYDYLEKLTSLPVPGFGTATFAAKYGQDHEQILTEIYDYVRISNAADNSMGDPDFVPFTIPPQTVNGVQPSTPGAGQVLPFRHPSNDTQGAGRFQTISEAAVIFSAEVIRGELRHEGVTMAQDATLPSLSNLSSSAQYPQFNGNTEKPFEFMPSEIVMRAVFVTETATVAHGFGAYDGGLEMEVTGLDTLRFRSQGAAEWVSLGFPEKAVNTIPAANLTAKHNHHPVGGINGILHTLRYPVEGQGTGLPKRLGRTDPVQEYPFYGDAVAATALPNVIEIPVNRSHLFLNHLLNAFDGGTFDFSGGNLVVTIRAGEEVIQTIHLSFPEATGLPLPKPAGYWHPNNGDGVGEGQARDLFFAWPRAGDYNLSSWVYDAASNPRPRPAWNQSSITWYLVHYNDTVRSLQLTGPAGPVRSPGGDLRLAAYRKDIPATFFSPHEDYFSSSPHADGLTYGGFNPGNYYAIGQAVHRRPSFGNMLAGVTQAWLDSPKSKVPAGMNGVLNQFAHAGDFDNGVAGHPDGPWINKPDEGDTVNAGDPATASPPYYGNIFTLLTGESNFSPNRMLPSPVMFGSLPTGVRRSHPWQTLLFCPNPAAVSATGDRFSADAHEGFSAPRDHLLLDLFWMPTVEPYAISDPFSTSGKVNMNYGIFPFTYLTRDTAMRGVLESAELTAIPTTQINRYKDRRIGQQANNNYRYAIDPAETLKAFEEKFANGEVFRSATEICEVFLIPKAGAGNAISTTGLTRDNILNFWNQAGLTGDNSREAPYAHLYPRLTTKSNTFCVHYRVETLKKVPSTQADIWEERRDKVLGERRGSFLVERYIDPNDPDFNLSANRFAEAVAGEETGDLSGIPTLDRFYQFRILQSRQLLR